MRTTSALAKWTERIIASLHPPSPPTAKEGQRFLNILESSFQRQLDAEHPSPQHRRARHADDDVIPTTRQHASARQTRSLLSSLLTNPTLATPASDSISQVASRAFTDLAAKPELDLDKLRDLLVWYRHEIKHQRLKRTDYDFGEKLDLWFRSTKSSDRENFLARPDCLSLACDILLRERNEGALWNWLALIYERDQIEAHIQDPAFLRIEDYVVSRLIELAMSRANAAEAAHQFINACRYRWDSGRADPTTDIPKHHTSALQSVPFVASSNQLVRGILYHRHNHGISADTFAAISHYLPDFHTNPVRSWQFCNIYNPAGHGWQTLYNTLIQHQGREILFQRQKNSPFTSRRETAITLLDAGKFALDHGNRTAAELFLNIATEDYPDILPSKETEQLEPQLEISSKSVVPVRRRSYDGIESHLQNLFRASPG